MPGLVRIVYEAKCPRVIQLWRPGTNASTSYTVNNLNQYATVGGTTQSYDLNGNLTGDGTTAFTYDAENRLLTACRPVACTSPTLNVTYSYDPLGRRTKKTGTGVTETYYLSDGTDEIAEYDTSSTVLARTIPGPAIDEPIARVDGSGTKTFYHTDKQGSVVAMSDASGALAEGPYMYDAYGNCFSSGSACSTSGQPYRYTGRRWDAEIGCYYYRARFYCPDDKHGGRFLQIDPVGYTADLNLYTYVGNDPMDKVDPKGNFGLGLNAAIADVEIGYDYPSGQFFLSGRVGFSLPPGPYIDFSPSSIPSAAQQASNACGGCKTTWSNFSASAGVTAGPYYWMPVSYEGDTDVTTYRSDGSIESSHETGEGWKPDLGRVGNTWDKAPRPSGRKGNPLGSHKHPRIKNPINISGGGMKEFGTTFKPEEIVEAVGNAYSNRSDKPGQIHLCTGSILPTRSPCGF